MKCQFIGIEKEYNYFFFVQASRSTINFFLGQSVYQGQQKLNVQCTPIYQRLILHSKFYFNFQFLGRGDQGGEGLQQVVSTVDGKEKEAKNNKDEKEDAKKKREYLKDIRKVSISNAFSF